MINATECTDKIESQYILNGLQWCHMHLLVHSFQAILLPCKISSQLVVRDKLLWIECRYIADLLAFLVSTESIRCLQQPIQVYTTYDDKTTIRMNYIYIYIYKSISCMKGLALFLPSYQQELFISSLLPYSSVDIHCKEGTR